MRGIKSLACAVAVAMSASVASAQLVNETFSYADGNLVGNDAWTAHSGTTAVTVASGAAVVNMANSQDVNKPIGATLGAGGIFYAGLDVSVSHSAAMPVVVAGTATAGTVEYFAHFKDNTSAAGTAFRGRIFTTGIAGSDYTFGIRATSGTNPNATWATGFTYGTTQRVVVSYNFDTGESKLWVNPANELSLSISDTGGSLQSIAAFALRQSNAGTQDPSHTVDNLCVDTTFDGANLCVPEPGTLALLGFGAMVLIRRRR